MKELRYLMRVGQKTILVDKDTKQEFPGIVTSETDDTVSLSGVKGYDRMILVFSKETFSIKEEKHNG